LLLATLTWAESMQFAPFIPWWNGGTDIVLLSLAVSYTLRSEQCTVKGVDEGMGSLSMSSRQLSSAGQATSVWGLSPKRRPQQSKCEATVAPDQDATSMGIQRQQKSGHSCSVRSPASRVGTTASLMAVQRAEPPPEIRHDISDLQLEILIRASRGHVAEKQSLSLGVAIGLVPECFKSVYAAYFNVPSIPLSGLSVCLLSMLTASLSFAVAVTLASRNRINPAKELAAELRARHNTS